MNELKTLPVAWFNDRKGYGFLKDGDKDVFIHFTAIEGANFKTLSGGQQVDCVVIDGPKGPQALHVTKRLDLPVIEQYVCAPDEDV